MNVDATPVPFLDLARQSQAVRAELDAALARVVSRGWYVLGEEGAAFERAFAAECGVRHGVGLNSGTDALTLGLLACGIERGEGVITAANTAVPTICAIVDAGTVPILVDIDLETYNLDPDALRRTLKNGHRGLAIKAVIPVHLYGHPAAMGPILELANEFGLKVVEDASQAHGTLHEGRPVGQIGDVGCFSFYPTKNLGAIGDAGIAVTNDDGIADRLRMLRNYGEESKYRNRMRGVNSRLDEIQAAVLLEKLPRLAGWVERRRELAHRYTEELADLGLALPVETEGSRHSYHLYVVRSKDRERLRQELARLGIGSAVHYPLPVHLQEAYRDLGHAPGSLPNAEQAAREVLSLPLFPELSDDEAERVVAGLRLVCGRDG